MNNSTSLQNSLHQWRRDIYGKRKKVSRGTRTKNSEREAQPKREASRAKARRGKQNGIKKANGNQNKTRGFLVVRFAHHKSP